MFKNFIVCFLMVLLPIKIWAQKPVMFDFPEPAKDDVISTLIEKNGITLRFSSKSGKESLPQYSHNKEYSYLKLDIDELLTIEGKECVITSIKFVILDNQRCLKVYEDKDIKLSCRKINNRSSLYKQQMDEKIEKVTFCPQTSLAAYIKSIEVSYIPLVSISAAKRATFYYGDKSFIIPDGVVARTYKIEGNILSQNKEYKAGMVLPKGTAVVLEANEGKYSFEETQDAGETDSQNALRGSDVKTMTTGGEIYYVFGKGRNGIGFYWKEPEGKPFTTEAHKAYLVYSPPISSQAKNFLGFDVTLEVQKPIVTEKATMNSPIYNLSGQQVKRDYKGIIIMNGKKYLNR